MASKAPTIRNATILNLTLNDVVDRVLMQSVDALLRASLYLAHIANWDVADKQLDDQWTGPSKSGRARRRHRRGAKAGIRSDDFA